MPSPRLPDPTSHARQERPADQSQVAAPPAAGYTTPTLGPDHHLRGQWHDGYPGIAITTSASEALADRELIGE